MSRVDKKPVGASPSKCPWSEEFLQTAAVVGFIVVIVGSFYIFFILLHVLFFTKYYYLSVIYYLWLWYDRRTNCQGGRRLECLRHTSLFRYITNYFPVKVKTSAQLDPNKNYICGYHPHGILCIGAVNTFGFQTTNFTKNNPKMKPHLTSMHSGHFTPILREIFQLFGICSVSKESISWLLNNGNGNMAVVVIGGVPEQRFAASNTLVLSNRKGFVKLAIQCGAPLVPIYAFGENKLFKYFEFSEGSLLRKWQDKFKKLTGSLPPILYGQRILPFTRLSFVPCKRPIDVVFGTPIEVKQNSNPTEEDINFYHNLYVQSLLKLFNEHKINYDEYRNVDLEIL